MENFLGEHKVTRLSNAVAAGTTDVNATHVDMSGYEGVVFVAALGTLTATAATGMHAQQGQLSDDSDMADLAGTQLNMVDTEDNKLLVLEVVHPEERYVRPVLDRATANAVIDGIIAIQYGGKKAPETQPASVSASATIVSPAEGTP
jgi:hypothetical protein